MSEGGRLYAGLCSKHYGRTSSCNLGMELGNSATCLISGQSGLETWLNARLGCVTADKSLNLSELCSQL